MKEVSIGATNLVFAASSVLRAVQHPRKNGTRVTRRRPRWVDAEKQACRGRRTFEPDKAWQHLAPLES